MEPTEFDRGDRVWRARRDDRASDRGFKRGNAALLGRIFYLANLNDWRGDRILGRSDRIDMYADKKVAERSTFLRVVSNSVQSCSFIIAIRSGTHKIILFLCKPLLA